MKNVNKYYLSEIKVIDECECIMCVCLPIYVCLCVKCVRVCDSVCCDLRVVLYGKQNLKLNLHFLVQMPNLGLSRMGDHFSGVKILVLSTNQTITQHKSVAKQKIKHKTKI